MVVEGDNLEDLEVDREALLDQENGGDVGVGHLVEAVGVHGGAVHEDAARVAVVVDLPRVVEAVDVAEAIPGAVASALVEPLLEVLLPPLSPVVVAVVEHLNPAVRH